MGPREPMSPLKWYVECFIAGGGKRVELASVFFYEKVKNPESEKSQWILREPWLSGGLQSVPVPLTVLRTTVVTALEYKISFS